MFISLFRNPCICLLSFGLARSLARLEPLKIWFLFRFMILFIALLIITIKISLCFYRILASSLKIFTVRHDWKKNPGKVWKKKPGKIRTPQNMISKYDIKIWYKNMIWKYDIIVWYHSMISYFDILLWYHIMISNYDEIFWYHIFLLHFFYMISINFLYIFYILSF